MEEEWMRDRALLRDLLEKTPHASPQELAQAIGRGVALGQEVAQATGEIRDLHDPSVLCSYSRAHHAPYFRWDVRVTQKMVEMRFAPPENADRVCLGLGPCSTTFPVTQSCKPHRFLCPAPAERSGRSSMLLAAWSLVPKSHPIPTSFESHWKRSRWMRKDVGSVSPDQSPQGKRKPGGRGLQFCGCWHFDCPLCPGPRGFPRTNSVRGGDRLLAKVRASAADDL